MPRFTLNRLFTPWTPATSRPTRQGWYRTRTEKLTHSWWNGMAYFDGQGWWHYGTLFGGKMSVRREVPVLEWQGLNCPWATAVKQIHANMPRSTAAQKRYAQFLADFGAVMA
jgi:hypothetical protein